MRGSGLGQSVNKEFTQFYALQPTIPISTFLAPHCTSHQLFCPPVSLAPPLFQAKTNIGQTSFCPKIRLSKAENKLVSNCVS